jgi:hypothetical protein
VANIDDILIVDENDEPVNEADFELPQEDAPAAEDAQK